MVYLYRCVAALSANVLSKVRKTTADISDNARATDLQTEETIIFREVIQEQKLAGYRRPENYKLVSDRPEPSKDRASL